MVLVEPSQRIEVSSPGPTTADSTAATRESIPVQPESFGDPAAHGQRSSRSDGEFQSTDAFTQPEIPSDEFGSWAPDYVTSNGSLPRLADDLDDGVLPNFVEAPPVHSESPAVGANEWTSSNSANPLVPSEQWVSQSTKRRRQMMLIAALAATSLVVTAVLFVAFVRWFGDSSKEVAEASILGNDSAQQAIDTDPSTPGLATNDPVATDPDTGQTPEPLANPQNGSSETNDSNTATVQPSPDTETESGRNPATNSDLPAAEIPNQTDPATMAPGETNSKPGELPSELGGDVAPPTEDSNKLADAVQTFSPVFDPSTIFATPNLGAPKANPQDEPTEPLPIPEVKPIAEATPPPAEPINLQQRLAMPVAGIIVDNKSLAETVALMTQISGIGIGWDFESLQAAGLSPQTPVKIRLKNTTVQGIFDEALLPQGIRLRVVNGAWLAVAATDEAISRMIPAELTTGDLAGDEAAESQLQSILELLLPEISGDCKIQNGKVDWIVDSSSNLTVFRLLSVLERLRTARNIPLTSQYPAEWFAVGWPAAPIVDLLDKPLQSVIVQEQPWAQILGKAGRDLGVSLLVDWPAVWQHGWTPSALDIILLRNRKMKSIISGLEEQYVVQLTRPAPGVLWLTTRTARNANPVIAVFRPTVAKSLEDGKKMLAPLAVQEGGIPLSVNSNAVPTIVVDPVSGVWLARIQAPTTTDPIP